MEDQKNRESFMISDKQNSGFFAFGKHFATFEELTEYASKFSEMPADIEYFRCFLDMRLREAELNARADPAFTNREMYRLLAMSAESIGNKI
jgi:hypothetical protein